MAVMEWASAIAGFVSAACWLWSTRSITREAEIERRRRVADKTGEQVSLASVEIDDGDKRYELMATLRHQSIWSKWGAVFAAAAIALQSISPLISHSN